MMEKIKLFLKSNYQSIIIFIGIILTISPVILSKPLNDLDEIWNYNFAKNVADGLIPYRDFNMVPTPLLPIIAGFILKLFGNELIVMRILAILLISSLFFMIFKILKKLNVNIIYNLSCIFLYFLILKDYICIDYNFSVLFLTLILIYLELNIFSKNKNSFKDNFNNNLKINKNNLSNEIIYKKNNYLENYYLKNNLSFYFLIGLICSCIILLKQSTGIIISMASIFYPILFVKNKIDLKKYLKISFIKIIGILIPIILLIIYLIFNNAFYDFIDYTILGIKTFSNSISYLTLINSNNILIKLLSIFMPIFILIFGIYLIIKKDKKLYGFYFYSIASLIVIYPISDVIHFLIGITPLFILFVYLAYNLFNYLLIKSNDFLSKHYLINKIKMFIKELLKAVIIFSLICYSITSCILINKYLNNSEKNHTIKHYKNIPISEGLINKINEIDNYILSQNTSVYILDSEAAIYMISINKYNKDFDMFNKGNLGSQGEIGQIEKIKSFKKGTKILIKNNKYSLNWQTPTKVIYYIRNNLNKIGEINIFDIYEI